MVLSINIINKITVELINMKFKELLSASGIGVVGRGGMATLLSATSCTIHAVSSPVRCMLRFQE